MHARAPVISTLLVAAALCLVGAACSGGSGDRDPGGAASSTQESQTSTTTADEPAADRALSIHGEPDQTLFVAVGARFGLRVVIDPSSGTRWQVAGMSEPDLLLPLGVEVDGFSQVLTFAAQLPGETTVDLVGVAASGAPLQDAGPVVFTVVATPDGLPPPPPTTSTSTAP